ncbi:purine-nucleoside phosphorylase [Brucepastera parasyntrophica]|uniref:purine-nucleoside phosphorylase n=1 Tax=Brucepastera parasyntrophica TaxID=2880008 RepID=UPI002109B7E8|nr:purine-nucleoside phosphorylase [Brucepastera parasyntrophica]ULQ58874.1 purine-nucleoside phosphorylase [Brucepastera parasyntrophica]
MSTHIGAKPGEIAEDILLPGDPLRAKFIAETYLENPVCYNEVRGMYGFTGTYKGKRISVQGTGMGQPSISIYANELFRFYGVKRAIRVGTCGGIQPSANLRDIVIAMSACTDSSLNGYRFGGRNFAPTASFNLLKKAWETAATAGITPLVGSVASSDMFYDDKEAWKLWAQYGILGIEMEAAELYTLAAFYNREALAILTVSDHIAKGTATTAEERQKTFNKMMEIALDALSGE